MEKTIIKTVENNRVHYDYFPSIPNFVEYIDGYEQKKDRRLLEGSSHTGSKSFTGTKDMAQSMEYAREGYELDKIDAELKEIKGTDKFELNPAFDVAGNEVEMGLFMTGVPESMIEYNIDEVKNKYVHLIIGASEACGISSNQIVNRSAAICSIVDMLENNQYRVRLSYLFAGRGFGHSMNEKHSLLIDIKDYNTPMDMALLAGMLHPGFLRRLVFGFLELHPNWIRHGGYYYILREQEVKNIIVHHDQIDVGDQYLYLPSITEASGGSIGIMKTGFNMINEAKEYAEHVSKHIEDMYTTKQ